MCERFPNEPAHEWVYKDGDVYSGTARIVVLNPGQTVLPTQANSSQVTKSNHASAGGQTIPPSRTSLQETVQLAKYYRVITKQLVERWLELAEVAKR